MDVLSDKATLELQRVVPDSLGGRVAPDTDIWRRDVTFTAGERYQIFAPSGRGKTTFIHLLYGLRDEFEGTARLFEQETHSITREEWARIRRERLGIVFQDLRLFLHLDGLEKIRVKSELRAHVDMGEIASMCRHLGIGDVLDRPCGTLSYGERQRVAIVRALSQPFDFLLLDEPFSHLDPENIARAWELISSACEARGAGCLVTSLHDASSTLDFDQTLRL